jgi:hypothetical protein
VNTRRATLCLLALAACERPSAPSPTAPDPVHAARTEFELVDGAYRAGTSKLYSRGDFFDDPFSRAALDEGDFIGRLQTLFGPQPGGEYVLRHKATGFIITAYSAQSGPSFGGGPRYPGALPAPDARGDLDQIVADAPAIAARMAADPVVAAGDPAGEVGAARTPSERAAALKKLGAYDRHLADLRAPVGFPVVAARLDALVEAVPPADWDRTGYDEDSETVVHVGAAHGASFSDELDASASLTYLLANAEAARPAAGSDPDRSYVLDEYVIDFYLAHAADLAAFAPRVRAAWDRFARLARAEDDELRDLLVTRARATGLALELSPSHVAAALP